MLKKISKKLLPLSFALLVSCAGLPPDVPMCTEITMERGYCVNWISGKSFEVDNDHPYEGKTWWDMRPAIIQVPVSSYKKIKPWLIKACKKNKNMCDKEISSWERTIEIIDTNIVGDKD